MLGCSQLQERYRSSQMIAQKKERIDPDQNRY
jgi:hypothetical protein